MKIYEAMKRLGDGGPLVIRFSIKNGVGHLDIPGCPEEIIVSDKAKVTFTLNSPIDTIVQYWAEWQTD